MFKLLFWITVSITVSTLVHANEQTNNAEGNDITEPLLKQGQQRIEQNQSAQKSVTSLAEQSQQYLKQYMDELTLVKNLTLYNKMLDNQLATQEKEIDTINNSIANATLIERQILPLLDRMVTSLSNFIKLDVPFLLDERKSRIQRLKDLLNNAKLTTSEKARRVFEAYQIENEFGYTIEAYKGNVNIDNKNLAVEFLRIGRIALLYRDMSGEYFGFWNNKINNWQTLNESQFKRYIDKGLKIAKEEIAPELITIPLLVNLEDKQ